MDTLDSFGQLSTTAKEWKPPSAQLTSDRQLIFASDRTVYGSSGGTATGFVSNDRVPQSPVPQASPIRTGGLLPSPPGRTAWQQHQVGNSGDFANNPYIAAGSWGASPTPSQQAPVWPDVTIADHQQQEFSHGAAENNWQQFGPISIPAGPPPPPTIRSLHTLPDGLWRYFRDMSFESQREMDVSDPRNKAIPPAWGNAFPLDAPTGNKNVRSSFGYPILTFKVVSREDGYLYCLRRADNVRSVSNKIAQTVSDTWATAVMTQTQRAVLDHPGLVRFLRCFVANRAVFFIHQYCPGARTLRERFFASSNPGPLPEPIVWSCVTQLVAAIRAVHGGNLACRTLQLNHILCHGEGRIRLRINCLGIVDALEFEARKQIGELQIEDMRDLGRLILSLATGIEVTKTSDANTIRRCDVFVAQNCSPELHSLIVSLLLPNKPTPSVFAITNAIANYAMDELELQQTTLDRTEAALSAEYDSGRVLRLLLMMGFVNERPELGMNRRWTESGDCYVLKLFRDYVFHQADEAGNPVMDLGHIVTSLNKLDAAVEDERIILASRDGKTLMVVSYGDVARSLEKAYGELCNAAAIPHSPLYQY